MHTVAKIGVEMAAVNMSSHVTELLIMLDIAYRCNYINLQNLSQSFSLRIAYVYYSVLLWLHECIQVYSCRSQNRALPVN